MNKIIFRLVLGFMILVNSALSIIIKLIELQNLISFYIHIAKGEIDRLENSKQQTLG